ncbi:MAG: IclR family transcriptional regulator [Gemmobacter sp.]|nr:IclR family transcriptional regulator [Gemmobacter sp.]
MERDEAPQGAQLISRAAEVLRAFPRGAPEGRRLRDLATSPGLAEPTVRRILLSLIYEQFVVQDAETKRYKLGPLAFELGLASGFHAKVLHVCSPHLRTLAADTGMMVMLALRTGLETVCLDRADAGNPIHSKLADVGERLLLGVGTGGVALMAAMKDADVEEILSAPAYDHSPVSRDDIRTRLTLTRATGYADIADKPIEGTRGIGVAVPTARGLPTLSLSLVAVHSQLTDAQLGQVLPILRMTADLIGAALDLR